MSTFDEYVERVDNIEANAGAAVMTITEDEADAAVAWLRTDYAEAFSGVDDTGLKARVCAYVIDNHITSLNQLKVNEYDVINQIKDGGL